MSDVDTSGAERRRHKRWPEAVKREIVAATFEPGASVSVIARRYDVNANQVFAWRRRFREAGKVSAPIWVPVTITPDPEDKVAAAGPAHLDSIEIEIGGDCRVRVGSSFDSPDAYPIAGVLALKNWSGF